MAKPVKALLKLQIPGGGATPAPPVGSALGQRISRRPLRTTDPGGSIGGVDSGWRREDASRSLLDADRSRVSRMERDLDRRRLGTW